MPNPSEEFLKRLQATFVVEAAEHCDVLSAGLLQLENAPDDQQRPIIEKIFRSAHSLKGAARAVNLPTVEAACQRLENVFESWRRQAPRPASTAFDALHRFVDMLRRLVETGAESAGTGPAFADLLGKVDRLGETARAPERSPDAPPAADAAPEPASAAPAGPSIPAPVAPVATAAEPPLAETVRVATSKVERILYGTEELLAVKSTLRQRVLDLRETMTVLEQAGREWAGAQTTVRSTRQHAFTAGPAGAERGAMDELLGMLDRSHEANRTMESKLAALLRALEQDRHTTGKLVDSLLDETKALLLLPFGNEQGYFSKVVRDLARDQQKQVNFVCRGGDVELDKRILEEMKDPIVHLLRNSIDHGMERSAARTAAGKPARGTITLAATRLDNHNVEILVEDDGAGVNFGALRTAAMRRGLVTASTAPALSNEELLGFMFRSDVSTAPIVTEISGRGVGLAIVQEKVEHLGGRLSVHTDAGRGTAFRLVLPAAQSTFRGILVSVAEHLFVVPATKVERVHRAPMGDIKTVENRETVTLEPRTVAFVWLADVLTLPRPRAENPAPKFIEMVVVGSRERCVAFAVDSILGEEELLVKPLRKPLCRVRNIAGATVLGSGRVVPILNAADLLLSAAAAGSRSREAIPTAEVESRRRSILVAEDSITSRMLLKNIIESAGYAVKTAVDGLDALTTLRSEPADLVVSDVEMPRLDGFGLTRAMRADRKLAEIPVILVTALASRDDRERGIDAGANAYLVKSDFDQSNLLEAIRRYV